MSNKFSPYRFFIYLTLSVFIAEFSIMYTLETYLPLQETQHEIIDSVLLVVIMAPLIYLFAVRPLLKKVAEVEKSELDLKESASRLRGMSTSVRDALIMIDSEGNICFWNPAAEQIFGYPADEALGKYLHTLIIPERFREAYRKGFEHFQKTGEGAAIGKVLELTAIRKDGAEFAIELSLSAMALNNKWHSVGIVRDITARKKMEAEMLARDKELEEKNLELKESHMNLERKVKERTRELEEQMNHEKFLLESIGDGVVAIDRNWNITLWNKAASIITGWSKEEALGKPLRSIVKFISAHDRTENITFIEHAIVMGETTTIKDGTLLVKKDGGEIVVGDSAAPIMGEHGAEGVIIVFRDTSQEHEAAHLRTDFVYASHQLRTPVTEALWNLDLAINEQDAEKKKEDLLIVQNSLGSVQKLSEHLVSASEIDQGALAVKLSMVKLVDIFDAVKSGVEKIAGMRGITVSFNPISAMAATHTDPKLLKKALAEVVENAVIYSHNNTEVKINVTVQEKNILIEVADMGVGISEEEQPIIFTKFFRGSNRPKEVAGSGLGLYIAREYIKALGGKIWFESEEGKGSTFYISVPLLEK